MNETVNKMATGDWWISVVVVGLILSVAGNILTRKLDGLSSSAFRWFRNRSAKKREVFDAEVATVAGSFSFLSQRYYQMEMRARSEATHSLVVAAFMAIGFILFNPPFVSTKILPEALVVLGMGVTISAFSVAFLFSLKAEARAKRLEDISAAAYRKMSTTLDTIHHGCATEEAEVPADD